MAHGRHQQKLAFRVVPDAVATTAGGGGLPPGTVTNPRFTADEGRDPQESSPADADGLLAKARCEPSVGLQAAMGSCEAA